MKFCTTCKSLLYIKNTSGDAGGDAGGDTGLGKLALKYFCKLCQEYSDAKVVTKVFESDYESDSLIQKKSIIKYAKFDNSLPRLNIRCNDCDSDKGVDEALNKSYDDCIIYIRYDKAALKNIYICPKCDRTWKNKLKI